MMAPCAGMARGVSSIVSDPVVFFGRITWKQVVRRGLRATRKVRNRTVPEKLVATGSAPPPDTGNTWERGERLRERRSSRPRDASRERRWTPCRGRGRAACDGRLGDRPFSVFRRDQAARFPRPDGRRVRGATDVSYHHRTTMSQIPIPCCPHGSPALLPRT